MQIPAAAVEAGMAAFAPTVEGDRLTLDFDDKQLDSLVTKILNPILAQAHVAAIRLASARNMELIGIALYRYAKDHGDEFPPSLQTLVDKRLLDAVNLAHPARPGQSPGYVYLPPNGKPSPQGVVVYEAFDKFGAGVWVAFGDGHVELITDEAKFKALVPATSKPAAATSRPAGVAADWVPVDASGQFSFWLPPDMQDQKAKGIDSLVLKFKSEALELSLDLGMFSDPLDKDWGSTTTVSAVTVGGKKAKLVVCDDPNAKPTGTFWLGIHFPKLTDEVNSRYPKLTVVIRCKDAKGLQVAKDIIQTITFPPAPTH
jgi:hypothetical protein